MPTLTASDLERVCHMLTKEYGVRVVIGGDKCRTDGKGLIVLPTLPEIENETLLSVCRFFLDHEAGHIVGKSDGKPREQVRKSHGQAAGMILEALEDLRCERKMADLWAGCGVNIRRGSNEVLNHMAVDGRMEASRGVPAFQLMTAVYAAGHGHAIPEWVEPKIAGVVNKFTDEIKATAKSATCTSDLLDVTRRIFDAAQLPEDPPAPQQPGDGQKQDGEGECDNKGQGQPKKDGSEPDKNDEKKDGQGQGGQGQEGQGDDDGQNSEKTDASEGQEDQEDDGGGGSDDDGAEDDDSDAADSQGNSGRAADSSDGADGDSDSRENQSEGGGDEDGRTSDNTSGGGDGGTGADYSPGSNDLNDIPEGAALNNIAEEAAKTVGDELAAMVDEHGADSMARPVVPELDVVERFDEEADPGETCEFVAKAKRSGGPMRQKLAQMLLSEAKCWYRGGLKKGSPNPRALAGLVCGTTDRPMRRKFVRPAANTACCLLIDASGSMGSHSKVVRGRYDGTSPRRMEYAMLAGTAFCTVLESAGHKSMMMMFDSTNTEYELTGEAKRIFDLYEGVCYDPDEEEVVDLGLRAFGVRLRIVKGWSEQVIRCYPRMTAAQRAYHGGTPLGEAILLAGKDLIRRKEKRKVMMVFTDGQPTSATTVKEAERRLAAAGIELVLIGIGCELVRYLTDNYAIVNDVTKLGTETMEQLRKALHPGGRR